VLVDDTADLSAVLSGDPNTSDTHTSAITSPATAHTDTRASSDISSTKPYTTHTSGNALTRHPLCEVVDLTLDTADPTAYSAGSRQRQRDQASQLTRDATKRRDNTITTESHIEHIARLPTETSKRRDQTGTTKRYPKEVSTHDEDQIAIETSALMENFSLHYERMRNT
jgi:hypothetical protein